MRRAFNSDEREKISRALGDLHEDTQGQQVLLLFRTDRLIRSTESDLVTAKMVFDEVGRAAAPAPDLSGN